MRTGCAPKVNCARIKWRTQDYPHTPRPFYKCGVCGHIVGLNVADFTCAKHGRVCTFCAKHEDHERR
jgi:hypothetical protein